MEVKGSGIGDSTRIKYEKVEEAVDNIKKDSKSMDDIFGDFRKSMDNIYQDDVFEGNASESLHDKFDELKTKFDSYVDLVNEFSETINKAKTSTEDTEKRIQQKAEDLPH